MMQTRPTHADLTRRGLAGCDLSARSAAGWAGDHGNRRRKGLKAAWRDPKIHARRRAAIARALRDPDMRSRLSNLRLLSNAAKDLDRVFDDLFLLVRTRRTGADPAIAAAHAAYEAALCASAVALGLTLEQARRGNNGHAAGKARAIASYLTVTFFGVARRQLTVARGVDRRGLRRVLADVEAGRDDPEFDALVCSIEQGLRA